MILGAIRVDSPAESKDSTTPLPPWTNPRSPTKTTRSLKILRICPALSIKVPSTQRPSAGNSKSWVGIARTTCKGKGKDNNDKDGDDNTNPDFQ
jgi:hypothetical protein